MNDTSDASVADLLAAREIVVFCGSGGVGKTTSAAAAGLMAAVHLGGRVLVVTVDPARRLADALGVAELGNTEARVPEASFAAAGLSARGELWAAMLDTKASWDALVRRHAPDPSTRDRILANPLYENISGRFVQSHDYIAMERLYELHQSGRYDLIVVDTPPSRHALDFLDAPERMAEFFASRLLRWLTVPGRSRMLSVASRPFYQVADRILGSAFIEDIAEFFLLFQSMESGFVERARAVQSILGEERTSFVVVTTLESGPCREAAHLLDELARRRLDRGALVLNRVLPELFTDLDGHEALERLRAGGDELAHAVAPLVGEPVEVVARVFDEMAAGFENLAVVARREADQRRRLGAGVAATVSVPWFDRDVTDLAGLAEVGDQIWSG